MVDGHLSKWLMVNGGKETCLDYSHIADKCVIIRLKKKDIKELIC